ncbi:MAG TPA: hypothetical protein VLH10_06005 [Yinghuangia sp.]|jgi:hypothetical protein|uniref:PspA-associated protein PspAA n=1 Tax=Yinghuangia sp. YIM S10712 TaxID=3436930 RepID=UPI002B7426CB|nr:hypothetical protein [Yinghuangia sp.]
MIMRILGEGQYEVADADMDRLNELDAVVQSAADAGEDAAFAAAVADLLGAVRAMGTPLPDDAIKPSDLVLPDEDTSLEQVRAMLTDEGLVPG